MNVPGATAVDYECHANVTPLHPVPRAWRLALRRSRPTCSARAQAVRPRATTGVRAGGVHARGSLRLSAAFAATQERVAPSARQRRKVSKTRRGSVARDKMSMAASWTQRSKRNRAKISDSEKRSADIASVVVWRAPPTQQTSIATREGNEAVVPRCVR
eukprot:5080975-Pleurochrysis_carterae.AAC.1